MTITNGYCTQAELKARLDIASADTGDNDIIDQVVTAVSRQIETYCRRRFWKDTSATTRYYTPQHGDYLEVDDIVSVTSITVDEDGDRTYETTWAATDYDLMPFNASNDGWPYTWIEITPEGDYVFPAGMPKSVKIVAVFGWNAVPADVKEACLIQSARIFRRKDSPYGVTGPNEFGALVMMNQFDPDVAQLLGPYRRLFP